MATARYWRLVVTAVDTLADSVAAGEVELLDGGVDVTTGLGGSASQAGNGDHGAASAAVDDSVNTAFGSVQSSFTMPYWWQIDLGADFNVTTLKLTSQQAYLPNNPKDFTVEYSADGVNWVVDASVAGQLWTTAETRAYALSGIPTIKGDVPVTVAPAAVFATKKTLVGDAPVAVTPRAAISFKVMGDAPVAVTPQAVLGTKRDTAGDAPVSASVAAALLKYKRYSLAASAPVSIVAAAALLGRRQYTLTAGTTYTLTALQTYSTDVAGGGFRSAVTSSWSEYRALATAGGEFAASLGAHFGAHIEGGGLTSTLGSTLTGIPAFFVAGAGFASTLAATTAGISATRVRGGRLRTGLGSYFGARVTGGGFASSLAVGVTGQGGLAVAGEAFLSSADISLTGGSRTQVTGGGFNSLLLYAGVSGGGFVTALDAAIDAALANAVAYVLNLRTGESTRYTNQGFLHIITIGGKPYGVKSDGLYLLEGATDNGVAIVGSVTTKDTDFGAFASKRVQYAYLDSDTSATVTPIVDGVAKSGHASAFAGRKTTMSLKNQGRYWQLRIDGIVKLQGLELLPQVQQRRVK